MLSRSHPPKADLAAPHAALAGLLEELGDFDHSERQLREALQHDPRHAGALARLATRFRQQLPDADRRAIEALLDDPGLCANDRCMLQFGLAQVCDARVTVRILTGDHPRTATAIGRALGLPPEAVSARVTPEDKLRLVEQLQGSGEVVAVTGDGVNDAPALRQADVGIAMGRSGTEAAREASAIVLTDDNFATIVAAISEGRRIADNIRKVVAFLLSANLGEVVLFAIAILAGVGAPMTVVQVLTVNILTDGLPAIALARDPASAETMSLGPRPQAALIPRPLAGALGGIGLLVGLAGLAAYLIGRATDPATAQTMAYVAVALSELALVFSCRSVGVSAWRLPANRYLAGGVIISLALLVATVYVGALHTPFGTVSLGPSELAITVGLAVVPFVTLEAAKAVRRKSPHGEVRGSGTANG